MVSCDYGKSTSVDFSTGDRTAQVKWKKSVGAGRSKRWSLATMENRRAIFQQATARGRYGNDEECGRRDLMPGKSRWTFCISVASTNVGVRHEATQNPE